MQLNTIQKAAAVMMEAVLRQEHGIEFLIRFQLMAIEGVIVLDRKVRNAWGWIRRSE